MWRVPEPWEGISAYTTNELGTDFRGNSQFFTRVRRRWPEERKFGVAEGYNPSRLQVLQCGRRLASR